MRPCFPPVFYPPSGPGRPALEAFTVLAAVAARHPELRVGTLVARVTLRPRGSSRSGPPPSPRCRAPAPSSRWGPATGPRHPEHETFGIDLPPAPERIGILRETVDALGALFRGEAYAGGEHVPALTGPLVPPGSAERWVGGLSDRVMAVAARSADAWNGWGLDAEAFGAASARLRALSGDRAVPPTWGGIALVGRDRAELERLSADRVASGRSLDGVWTGTAAELRGFVEALRAHGATWFVVLPVGPEDRLDLIADALR
ncbi:MAG: LLM class flavin-dependent oxidoreductase [Actinomycetota bacterium]